jgi:phosphatidate cytidylyltransferase
MNETLKRALSGAVYIILLLSCIFYSKESLSILFGVFLLIGIYEFSKIIAINLIASILISGLTYFFLWDRNSNEIINNGISIFTILISIYLLYFLFQKKESKINNYTKYLVLFGYLVFPFILINYIPMGQNGYNPKILISILILIWTNDTFAYIVGKSIGRTKLFPSISPKKTIEGFLGGILFSIISGYLLAVFFIEAKLIYIWIVISIIVSIFSTLGDLIESKFKRLAGVKDSGKIMPGHGGILDRLDSIIFVIPFINLFYLILRYVS